MRESGGANCCRLLWRPTARCSWFSSSVWVLRPALELNQQSRFLWEEGIVSRGLTGNDKPGRLATVTDVSVPVRRRDGPGNIVKVGCQAGRGEALQNGSAVCPRDYP